MSVQIGYGALGLILGFGLNVIRARVLGQRTEPPQRGVEIVRCSELHRHNQHEHDNLFGRMAVAEAAIAASRATQEAMSGALKRIEEKLDRVVERR